MRYIEPGRRNSSRNSANRTRIRIIWRSTMGIDWYYQAIPNRATVLERARIDAAYSERIYGVSTFKREQPLPVDDEIELALRKDVDTMGTTPIYGSSSKSCATFTGWF